MGEKLANSWELVKASARVLMADRELLVFPLLSGIAATLVTVSFFVPTFVLGGGGAWVEGAQGVAVVTMLLYYVVLYTVVFFFNSALVGAALIRLEGGDPTVRDGFRIAGGRFGVIVGYALIAATVGMVLNAISSRSGIIGRILVGFVGMGWNLATYLAVPVLVSKNVGPVEAVRESAALFRRTWGEQVVGTMGMGMAFFLGGISLCLTSVALLVMAGWLGGAMLAVIGVVVLLAWIMFALSAAALKGIYAAALYRFAATGEAGWGFEGTSFATAFAPEGRR